MMAVAIIVIMTRRMGPRVTPRQLRAKPREAVPERKPQGRRTRSPRRCGMPDGEAKAAKAGCGYAGDEIVEQPP